MKTEYQKTVLPNGATVISEILPAMQTASVGFWFGLGSRNETDGLQGGCHYIEHMLFKGTSRRTARDIAVDSESVGAHMNAATGKEFTYFYAKSLSEDLPLMIDIIADMAFNSIFDPAEFDREKQVVLEEIKGVNDAPEDFVFEQFLEDFLGRVGLGHYVVGYEDTVGAMTRDMLFDMYRDTYSAEGLLVAVAGNLNGTDVPRLVAEALEKHDGLQRPGELLKAVHATPEFNRGIRVYNRKIEQVNFVIGSPGIPYIHEDRYAYSLLDQILSGGMSSRLFQEVREKRGLVYEIYTMSEFFKDAGVFSVCAGASPSNLREVLEITAAELRKVRDGDVSAEELGRVKQQFRAGMAMSMENPSGRMMKIARSEMFYGRDVPDDEIMERIQAVTLEDIARVMAEIARPDNFSASLLGPFNSKKAIKSVTDMVREALSF